MRLLRLFSLLVLFSCGSDDLSNTRAYVEANISLENHSYDTLLFYIISEGRVVAQTQPTPDGKIVLSGPLFGNQFRLKSDVKIASFEASRPGCTLSADKFSIEIPAGVNYMQFSEIKLQ